MTKILPLLGKLVLAIAYLFLMAYCSRSYFEDLGLPAHLFANVLLYLIFVETYRWLFIKQKSAGGVDLLILSLPFVVYCITAFVVDCQEDSGVFYPELFPGLLVMGSLVLYLSCKRYFKKPWLFVPLILIASYFINEYYVIDTFYKRATPLSNNTSVISHFEGVTLEGDTYAFNSTDYKYTLIQLSVNNCSQCWTLKEALSDYCELMKKNNIKLIKANPLDSLNQMNRAETIHNSNPCMLTLKTNDLWSKYTEDGYPVLLVVNRNGEIVHTMEGYRKFYRSRLEDLINKLAHE